MMLAASPSHRAAAATRDADPATGGRLIETCQSGGRTYRAWPSTRSICRTRHRFTAPVCSHQSPEPEPLKTGRPARPLCSTVRVPIPVDGAWVGALELTHSGSQEFPGQLAGLVPRSWARSLSCCFKCTAILTFIWVSVCQTPRPACGFQR